jgi:hypothetical protein
VAPFSTAYFALTGPADSAEPERQGTVLVAGRRSVSGSRPVAVNVSDSEVKRINQRLSWVA